MFWYSLLWFNFNGDIFDDVDEGSENLGILKLVFGFSEFDFKGIR